MNATEKKYKVYYNDEVNGIVEVFAADTLDECKQWINEDLANKTPVDEEHNCTDNILYSAKTFYYEVYDRPVVEVIDDEDIFNEPVYSTGYYYGDK